MIAVLPDTFAGGVIWTVLAFGVGRFVLELGRCSKGWRR